MPENPLLPNAQLQRLYSSMLRTLEGATGVKAGVEAILAAVALLLEPADAVVSSRRGDAFAQLLGPAKRNTAAARSLTASASPLAFAAGAAAGAQVAGNRGLVAVLLEGSQTDPHWSQVLKHAQSSRLPLIVLSTDRAGSVSSAKANGATLEWAELNSVAKRIHFPVLTVDGADAVAVYRAMQEAVLRARHGEGPALLWCLMPPVQGRGKQAAGMSPAERMERYLAARKIALPRPRAARKPTGLREASSRRRSPLSAS